MENEAKYFLKLKMKTKWNLFYAVRKGPISVLFSNYVTYFYVPHYQKKESEFRWLKNNNSQSSVQYGDKCYFECLIQPDIENT